MENTLKETLLPLSSSTQEPHQLCNHVFMASSPTEKDVNSLCKEIPYFFVKIKRTPRQYNKGG
jgi:hypothetical protein